jgi:pilus assembly protein CpaC
LPEKIHKRSSLLPRIRKTPLLLITIWALFQLPTAGWSANCPGFGNDRCTIGVEIHKSIIQETEDPITRASIADPAIADIQVITPRQILVIAKNQPGTTNLIVWHGDNEADVYEVRVVIPDDLINAIRQRIAQLVPNALVTAIPGGKGVLLNGEVSSSQMLDRVLMVVGSFDVKIVNLITVTGSQQVQLEVKIAEVSRSGAKKMGLGFLFKNDWNIGLFPSGGVSGALSTSNSTLPETVVTEVNAIEQTVSQYTTGGGLSQSLSSEIDLQAPFGSAFQLALHGVSDDFMAVLSLLKSQGLAQMLATPTLVTMSGQEAEFLVGGEFPIPVAGGFNETAIEFKQYGIILRFTPFVNGNETITIKVAPEVSNPDYSLAVFSGGVSVPGLKSRRGATTLQLKDGQTFIMAGLLMEELYSTVNKFPFLGDLPILGTLFTSKQFQKNETELMVMVTPRLVRALNADEVPALPGHGAWGDVNDVDFFLLNREPAMAREALPVQDDSAAPLPSRGVDSPSATGAPDGTVPGFQGKTGFTP